MDYGIELWQEEVDFFRGSVNLKFLIAEFLEWLNNVCGVVLKKKTKQKTKTQYSCIVSIPEATHAGAF